jgi:hypothetical protein
MKPTQTLHGVINNLIIFMVAFYPIRLIVLLIS